MERGYLERLELRARLAGNAAAGEIELITDPAAASPVSDARHRELSARGHPVSGGVGVVFEDEYILVVRDAVRFPSGATGTYLRVFERAGLDGPAGVVVVAARDGELYLRRVFRHATRAWELGIPLAGLARMGEVLPNTGLLASHVESWFATLGVGEPDGRPEAHEAFGEIVRVPVPRVRELIAGGELRDGISLSAIAQAEARGLLHG